jgi:hypothetical protein
VLWQPCPLLPHPHLPQVRTGWPRPGRSSTPDPKASPPQTDPVFPRATSLATLVPLGLSPPLLRVHLASPPRAPQRMGGPRPGAPPFLAPKPPLAGHPLSHARPVSHTTCRVCRPTLPLATCSSASSGSSPTSWA